MRKSMAVLTAAACGLLLAGGVDAQTWTGGGANANWSKPVLNLVSKPAWPDNNIIATDDGEPRFAFPCALQAARPCGHVWAFRVNKKTSTL